jgi:AmiR/NasT family two-component response regulator
MGYIPNLHIKDDAHRILKKLAIDRETTVKQLAQQLLEEKIQEIGGKIT